MNGRQRIRAIAKFYGRPTEKDGSAKIRCPAHEGLSYSLSLKPEPDSADRVRLRCYGRKCDPGEIQWLLYIRTGVQANPPRRTVPPAETVGAFLRHTLEQEIPRRKRE